MPDIILTRIYHSLEEEFGHLSKFGYIEISNGICWLAAVLLENNYDVEIIDALPLQMDNEQLVEAVVRRKPRCVGISACTLDIFRAAEFAAMLKKRAPEILTIIGGAHVTAVPNETMERFPDFDIAVVGEGEDTIIDLIGALKNESGTKLSEIDGIVYRENGSLISTRPRKFIEDIDQIPMPAWHLLPDLKENYFAPPWTMHGGCTATIITSRGCPFKCIYCDRKVFGNRVRYHSADYVLKMIKIMHQRYGIGHFRISDDNFIIHKKRLVAICEGLIREGLKITWSCLARADSIDTETLALMKKAGCWSIAFGVETGSQRIHDFEKKNINLKQIEKAVYLTRRAGIRTISFNIIGHPFETVDTIKETIAFNKKIKIDDFKTQFMIPFPGTELYQYAEKYGTFDRDWKKMGVFKEPIFVPHGLTKEDLIKWNKKGFWSFYLQPRIVLSYLTEVRSLQEIKVMLIGALTLVGWKLREWFHR